MAVEHNNSSTNFDYVPFWSFRSTRFWIAFILCFLVFVTVNMRSNIGMAMVCMVNSTVNKEITSFSIPQNNSQCQKTTSFDEVANLGYHGTYLWTPEMQGALISSTYYGSLITMPFSGLVADTYGPRLACLVALILYTAVTLLSPMLADFNYYVFIGARAIMGLAEGMVWPCIAAIIVKWYPKMERSTVAAIYTSGVQLGAGLGSIISSKLCLLSFFGGWPLIFYLYGVFGVVCILLWYLFATNKPDENKFISTKEIEYLQRSTGEMNGQKQKRLDVPWRKMFSSPVVWAIVLTRFAFCWQIVVMQMLLPSYLRDVLSLNMSYNGIFAACPFIAQLVSKNVCAVVTDYLRKIGKIGMTESTKFMECVAVAGSTLCLIGLVFHADCTKTISALAILIVYGLFIGGMVAGAFTASLCIAPELSGTIESASGFMGTLAMVGSSTTFGFINQTGSIIEWRIIFLLCAGIMIFSGTLFGIFGSADVQSWSKSYVSDNIAFSKIHPIETNESKKIHENDV